MDIKLPSDVIFKIMEVPITNGVLSAGLVSLLLISFALVVRMNLSLVPGRLQLSVEMVLGYFMGQIEGAYRSERLAKILMPFFLTTFFFLAVMNQFSVLPLVNQIVVDNGGDLTPLFRTATTDMSLPFAMALFVVIVSQVWAFILHPIRHIGNYFRFHVFFKMKSIKELPFAIIEFLLGFLDIIGEIAKVVSLSARLFGNIFAGEVMYVVIVGLASFTQFLLPIPFVVLSIFSGFVQAFVFAFLSLQFMAITLDGVADES